jgi:hypothetical protein
MWFASYKEMNLLHNSSYMFLCALTDLPGFVVCLSLS